MDNTFSQEELLLYNIPIIFHPNGNIEFIHYKHEFPDGSISKYSLKYDKDRHKIYYYVKSLVRNGSPTRYNLLPTHDIELKYLYFTGTIPASLLLDIVIQSSFSIDTLQLIYYNQNGIPLSLYENTSSQSREIMKHYIKAIKYYSMYLAYYCLLYYLHEDYVENTMNADRSEELYNIMQKIVDYIKQYKKKLNAEIISSNLVIGEKFRIVKDKIVEYITKTRMQNYTQIVSSICDLSDVGFALVGITLENDDDFKHGTYYSKEGIVLYYSLDELSHLIQDTPIQDTPMHVGGSIKKHSKKKTSKKKTSKKKTSKKKTSKKHSKRTK